MNSNLTSKIMRRSVSGNAAGQKAILYIRDRKKVNIGRHKCRLFNIPCHPGKILMKLVKKSSFYLLICRPNNMHGSL